MIDILASLPLRGKKGLILILILIRYLTLWMHMFKSAKACRNKTNPAMTRSFYSHLILSVFSFVVWYANDILVAIFLYFDVALKFWLRSLSLNKDIFYLYSDVPWCNQTLCVSYRLTLSKVPYKDMTALRIIWKFKIKVWSCHCKPKIPKEQYFMMKKNIIFDVLLWYLQITLKKLQST